MQSFMQSGTSNAGPAQSSFGQSGAWGASPPATAYGNPGVSRDGGPQSMWANNGGGGAASSSQAPWAGAGMQASTMEMAAPWATGGNEEAPGAAQYGPSLPVEQQSPGLLEEGVNGRPGLRQSFSGRFGTLRQRFSRNRASPGELQPEESMASGQASASQASVAGAEAEAPGARPPSPTQRLSERLKEKRRKMIDDKLIKKLANTKKAERKDWRAQLSEEGSWLRPLVFAVTTGSRRCASRIFALLARIVGDLWLDPMFMTDDTLPADRKAPSWKAPDDGLYRAGSSVLCLEPWNRERLHLGVGRYCVEGAEAEEVLAEEEREILGCGLCAPRLAGDGAGGTDGSLPLAARVRSHGKSKRHQLQTSQLYELRLDVSRVTILRVPRLGIFNFGSFEALDTDEGRAAAELQEIYRRYRQEADADLTALLNGRLEALAEHGAALRQAMEAEQQASPEVRERGDALEAYRQHLDERHKTRMRRNDKEHEMDILCRNLYSKWRELRDIRERQGFTSTPWKLRARPEEHDPEEDARLRDRDKAAEIEERVSLKGDAPERVQQIIEHSWATKRGPGERTYQFEVFMGEELTANDVLELKINDERSKERSGELADSRWKQWQEEIVRRRAAVHTQVRIECFVGDAFVGRSKPFPLRWDTWSTTVRGAKDGRVAGSVSSTSQSTGNAPIHSFDLALHTMPRHVRIIVHASTRSRFGSLLQKWHHVADVEVDVPSFEGRRVTHAAVLDHNLVFGPQVAAANETAAVGDGGDDSFSGEMAVRVSWPGAGRAGGFAVPPHRLSTMGSANSPGAQQKRGSSSPRHFSPRGHAHTASSRARSPGKADERLAGLRYDPQDPESARMMLESPAPKAFPGYDLRRLDLGSCRFKEFGPEDLKKTRRIHRLLQRAEREGVDGDRIAVPAFERQVPDGDDDDAGGEILGSRFRRGSGGPTDGQKDFERRIKARVRKVTAAKTHLSYKSIVKEHGEEAEESNLFETLEHMGRVFLPKRKLRPQSGKRKTESTAKAVKIHVSLAKVYHAPIRAEGLTGEEGRQGQGAFNQNANRFGSFAGNAAGAGMGGRSGGMGFGGGSNFGGSPPGSSNFGGSGFGSRGFGPGGAAGAPGSFGQSPNDPTYGGYSGPNTSHGGYAGYGLVPVVETGPPKAALPEVIIEMSLPDLDGVTMSRRTMRISSSTDPDINQILELPLLAASKEELTHEHLQSYRGDLALNVFDEIAMEHPERGGYVSTRIQRRFLGRFVLPWSTLYASKGNIKGLFRIDSPTVILGYRSKQRQNDTRSVSATSAPRGSLGFGAAQSGFGQAAAGFGGDGAGGFSGDGAAGSGLAGDGASASEATPLVARKVRDSLDPEGVYIRLDVTMDPALVPPVRVTPQIVKGKESSVVLKHVNKWLESFKMQKDRRVLAFGTDTDGRSRLICRFIRTQQPPAHIDPASPFAIEAAARYVSMIPFLPDSVMFPQFDDLWCTDQEFLNIQCGDWEEHSILLCNYFNYIDRYRRDKVEGYHTYDIQSFCVLCDVLPHGEVLMVLRRDMGDDQGRIGHCEIWESVHGHCYFLPSRDNTKPSILQRLSLFSAKAHALADPDDDCQGTPAIPIQRVHLAFNSENVWANLQKPNRKDREAGIRNLDFDFNNTSNWKPLFAKGKEEELIHLSPEAGRGIKLSRSSSGSLRPSTPTGVRPLSLAAGGGASSASSPADTRTSYRLEDPSQALVYIAPDELHAQKVERELEEQLEDTIVKHRSMGEHGGVQQTTKFDGAIARRLSDVLSDLEKLANCKRRSGNESIFPLRSHVPLEVSMQQVEAKLQDIENDWRGPGQRRRVFGIPLNQPYELGDIKHIWQAIRGTRILELGDEYSDYALKVRAFPYACNILSVWVFIACAFDN